jgi:hypothetical protein
MIWLRKTTLCLHHILRKNKNKIISILYAEETIFISAFTFNAAKFHENRVRNDF